MTNMDEEMKKIYRELVQYLTSYFASDYKRILRETYEKENQVNELHNQIEDIKKNDGKAIDEEFQEYLSTVHFEQMRYEHQAKSLGYEIKILAEKRIMAMSLDEIEAYKIWLISRIQERIESLKENKKALFNERRNNEEIDYSIKRNPEEIKSSIHKIKTISSKEITLENKIRELELEKEEIRKLTTKEDVLSHFNKKYSESEIKMLDQSFFTPSPLTEILGDKLDYSNDDNVKKTPELINLADLLAQYKAESDKIAEEERKGIENIVFSDNIPVSLIKEIKEKGYKLEYNGNRTYSLNITLQEAEKLREIIEAYRVKYENTLKGFPFPLSIDEMNMIRSGITFSNLFLKELEKNKDKLIPYPLSLEDLKEKIEKLDEKNFKKFLNEQSTELDSDSFTSVDEQIELFTDMINTETNIDSWIRSQTGVLSTKKQRHEKSVEFYKGLNNCKYLLFHEISRWYINKYNDAKEILGLENAPYDEKSLREFATSTTLNDSVTRHINDSTRAINGVLVDLKDKTTKYGQRTSHKLLDELTEKITKIISEEQLKEVTKHISTDKEKNVKLFAEARADIYIQNVLEEAQRRAENLDPSLLSNLGVEMSDAAISR